MIASSCAGLRPNIIEDDCRMKPLARRRMLTLMFGVGAAAACGLSMPGSAEAAEATGTTPVQPADAAQAVAETVESELQPNQFYIVRRRRYVRRRVFIRRPRRVFIVRRRPRRYFIVRRRRW